MEKLNEGAAKLGLKLTQRQLEQFQLYYEELTKWNTRFNLTAIIEQGEVQTKHFLDSLTLILAWQTLPIGTVIDIGTGAGFPGLPLKIAFPQLKLSLLEATAKKTVFLQELKQKLGLLDLEIITGRAEQIAHQPKYREHFNLVVSRAVAPLPTLVELALPFCRSGGIFIAQKKGDVSLELTQAEKVINLLGGQLDKIVDIRLDELLDERKLVVIKKIAPTPIQYPRRPGIPAKRPVS